MKTVHTFSDLASASLKAAEIITSRAVKCVHKKGYFSLVLAGGNTPKLLYQMLASPPFSKELPWQHIYFFWGDERMVPLDHPDSNAAMVFQNLLNSSDIPAENIFPIPAGGNKAGHNARLYEQIIKDFFKQKLIKPAVATFDCILLGMGTDGHIASLFPNSQALKEENHFTAAVAAPTMHPVVDRVTMTLPVINRATTILFLIDGCEKDTIAHAIRNNHSGTQQLPAAQIQANGELIWCTSRATKNPYTSAAAAH